MSGIVLTLSSDAPFTLPLARFGLLQGAFYRLLAADEALARTVHDKPHGTDKQYKFFCFSDLHGAHRVRARSLVFTGDVTWELRCADERIVETLRRATENEPPVTLGEHRLRVSAVEPVDTAVKTRTVRWKTDTPVLYYRTDECGFSTYFAPTDPAFCAGLERGAVRKYTAFFGAPPAGDVRISLRSEPRKCVTRYKQSVITGYYAAFEVTADPALLTFLYDTGLGAKNSMGFGTMRGV